MSRSWRSRGTLSTLATAALSLAPAAAWAKKLAVLPGVEGADSGPQGLENDPLLKLASAWSGFSSGWSVLDMGQVLVVSVLLGALIAYHPMVRRKAQNLEQIDQPKTFIMYSLVGALSALLAQVNSVLSIVVFGIGGLMRFRTDVGEAKDTGRVILVTVVGICCGARHFMEASLATGFAWILLWYLERGQITGVMIQGIDREHIGRASEAYRRVFAEYGCRILGEKKNAVKGWINLTVKAPVQLDRDALDRYFDQVMPKELRGSIDWNVS